MTFSGITWLTGRDFAAQITRWLREPSASRIVLANFGANVRSITDPKDTKIKPSSAPASMKAFISYNETCTYMLLLPPENEVCEGYVFTRVCHSGVGVICLSACWDTSPQEQTPDSQEQKPQSQEQAPPGAGTPQEHTPPGAVHAGRYGLQAGGMHPTGMHSCFFQVTLGHISRISKKNFGGHKSFFETTSNTISDLC